MIGAIIGDIAGSRFEWDNNRSKEYEMFDRKCRFTDDSVMTLAICDALIKSRDDFDTKLSRNAVESMQRFGKLYPNAGYGRSFNNWIFSKEPKPYNSYGNGAAMRVSGCAYAANSLEEAKKLSRIVTEVTHNHPEGIKGAEATVSAVYLARTGKSKAEIEDYIMKNYYDIEFVLDDIREKYKFDVSCQGSVPQAFEAFFEATGFEDAIRNATSIGGDSDTIAAITGSIAEAYYGVPRNLRESAISYLDTTLESVLLKFEQIFPDSFKESSD